LNIISNLYGLNQLSNRENIKAKILSLDIVIFNSDENNFKIENVPLIDDNDGNEYFFDGEITFNNENSYVVTYFIKIVKNEKTLSGVFAKLDIKKFIEKCSMNAKQSRKRTIEFFTIVDTIKMLGQKVQKPSRKTLNLKMEKFSLKFLKRQLCLLFP